EGVEQPHFDSLLPAGLLAVGGCNRRDDTRQASARWSGFASRNQGHCDLNSLVELNPARELGPEAIIDPRADPDPAGLAGLRIKPLGHVLADLLGLELEHGLGVTGERREDLAVPPGEVDGLAPQRGPVLTGQARFDDPRAEPQARGLIDADAGLRLRDEGPHALEDPLEVRDRILA